MMAAWVLLPIFIVSVFADSITDLPAVPEPDIQVSKLWSSPRRRTSSYGSYSGGGSYGNGYGGGSYGGYGGGYGSNSHTTYSHTSAGGEVKDTASNAVMGFVLFLLGFPVLWFNERREAVMWELFGKAARICVTDLQAKPIDKSNDHNFVHVQGETNVVQKLEDREFQIQVNNCAGLCREVQMYQWAETSHSESKDDNRGGKETKTTYSYHEEWSSTQHDSSSFHDSSYRNCAPALSLGAKIDRPNEVTFGAFTLTKALADTINNFVNCNDLGQQECQVKGYWYTRQAEWYTTQKGNPQVGDIRVKFSKAPCGPTTVLAVQKNNTFAPFAFDDQVDSSGKVKLKADHEQALLETGGNKKHVGIELDTSSKGGALCLCCKAIGEGFASSQHVYALETSHTSAKDMLAHVAAKQEWIHKVCKAVGWFMMVFGLSLLFALGPAVFRFIPFIGTWLQGFFTVLTNILALLLGSGFAMITIAIAWFRYHPKYAVILICAAVLCFAIPFFLPHDGPHMTSASNSSSVLA